VLRRLAGKTEHTAPVLTLITQFAGGKTHTLTASSLRADHRSESLPGPIPRIDRQTFYPLQ
jgi:predicted AAA+ superfamily ATPase